MARQSAVDKIVLEAALVGLEHQKSEIDAKVAEIRRRLRGLGTTAKAEPAVAAAPARRRKRVLSPAARKRIAEATKRRWAEYRAQKAAGSKKTGRKPQKKAAGSAAPESAA
jgi:negative regulator of sigma E activity